MIYLHCSNFSLPILSWTHSSLAYIPNSLLKMLLLRSPKSSSSLNPVVNSHFSSCLTNQKCCDLDDCLLFETLSSLGVPDSTLSSLSVHALPVSFASSYSTRHAPQLVADFHVSVLGPFVFSINTHSLGDIIQSHGLKYHLYVDSVGSQIYIFAWTPSPSPRCVFPIAHSASPLRDLIGISI